MINELKCWAVVVVLVAIPLPQIYAHYVFDGAKSIEKSPTIQFTIQQHEEKPQIVYEKQKQLVQHEPISSDDEPHISNDSVRDEDTPKHHKSYDKYNDVFDEAYADNNDIIEDDNNDHYDDINDDGVQIENKGLNTLSRKRRELSDWLIVPNTRWCGRGNTAEGKYNHLGGASMADKCCRRHDHCKLSIPSMSHRYELFNYRPYTLSHCSCDRRFRTCLKMANDEDAKTIGKIFFNMVQSQCFILHTEKVCQQRDTDGSCNKELVRQKAFVKDNKKF